eukprot:scaffold1778_cov246-Pinguiococcus_pyrenoidosus.AAC.2
MWIKRRCGHTRRASCDCQRENGALPRVPPIVRGRRMRAHKDTDFRAFQIIFFISMTTTNASTVKRTRIILVLVRSIGWIWGNLDISTGPSACSPPPLPLSTILKLLEASVLSEDTRIE